jgi:hypothetical protein
LLYTLQFAGKKIDKRLFQLGAEKIIEIGLGNDQHFSGYGVKYLAFYLLLLLYHFHVLEKSNFHIFLVIKILGIMFSSCWKTIP